MPPNPWLLLAAAGLWLATALGGYFYGVHHDSLSWQAAAATQKAQAAQLLGQADAAAAAADLKSQALATKLQAQHDKNTQAIADADSRNRAGIVQLCGQFKGRWDGSGCQLPRTPSGAAGSPGPAAGQPDLLPGRFFEQLAIDQSQHAEADKYLAQARVCRAFAVSIGATP